MSWHFITICHDFNRISSSFFGEDKNKQNYQNSVGIIHSLKQQVLFPKFCNSNSNNNNNKNNLQDLDTTIVIVVIPNKYNKSAINEYDSKLEEEYISDKQLYEIMDRINLLHLFLPFLGITNQSPRDFQASENEPQKLCDWRKVLIVGEQQKLAIGLIFLYNILLFLTKKKPTRILWHKPKLSFLDEWYENIIYERLSKNNITFISIGHRQSLLKYHHRVLYISGDGNWELLSRQ
ncbi:ABC transporter domain protein [Reticulomyxa filosa]|uniref:ABC transporter domain protein n=1 Tax=Reticulomyxa filosa TaxID=46433 RepID=X6LXY3_RETFI|nr:ABC transporter domain protein [Reticulomyxa filosa]|eukprot:ETO05590.1 ABC transporter domain protein [Reticulomyxa filosa]